MKEHDLSNRSNYPILALFGRPLRNFWEATIERSQGARTNKFYYLTLLVAGGGCFHPPLRFFWNISETAGARMLKFCDFPKTKLGIFPENFRLITVTGTVPEHRELGGPLRKVSLLGKHYDTDAL